MAALNKPGDAKQMDSNDLLCFLDERPVVKSF